MSSQEAEETVEDLFMLIQRALSAAAVSRDLQSAEEEGQVKATSKSGGTARHWEAPGSTGRHREAPDSTGRHLEALGGTWRHLEENKQNFR